MADVIWWASRATRTSTTSCGTSTFTLPWTLLTVPHAPELTALEKATLAALEARLGFLHVRQRLGLEHDYEAHVFRRGTHFFHIENWYRSIV